MSESRPISAAIKLIALTHKIRKRNAIKKIHNKLKSRRQCFADDRRLSAQICNYIHKDQYESYRLHYRMQRLLNTLPPYVIDNFEYDDKSIFEITEISIGEKLCKELLSMTYISPQMIITDCMAGVGGMTIAFAQHFVRVNAIELDRKRADMLETNCELMQFRNVIIYNGYCQDYYLQQDIALIDPPWGLDYKNFELVRLNIHDIDSALPLEEYILTIVAKFCVVKLPLNYDFAYLKKKISHKWTHYMNSDATNAYVIIIFVSNYL